MQSLEPSGEPHAAGAVIAGLDLTGEVPPDRPRTVAIMIGSVDGRAAVRGRSGPLGHPADRALLRTLRASVDAVLIGTRTLAAERYANILDPDQRAVRAAAGRAELPQVVTVSRSGVVPFDIPLFAEPAATIRVYAGEDAELPAPSGGAAVHVHRLAQPTLAAALAHLRSEAGVEVLACEGGPGLLRGLIAAGLLDDLLMTVAPLLVAGDEPAPLTGPELDPPVAMRLAGVQRAGEHLFCHYRVER
jgi:riboflavin biosynthesis pyrimidine reductase